MTGTRDRHDMHDNAPGTPESAARRLGEIAQLAPGTFAADLDIDQAVAGFRAVLIAAEQAAELAEAAAARISARQAARPQAEQPLAAAGECAAGEAKEVRGQIKWFDAARGFGFVVPDDKSPDVLLHVSCLRTSGYQTAFEGARIVVEAVKRARGLQATRVLSMDESTAIHPAMTPPRTNVVVAPESGWERAVVKWFSREKGYGFLTRGPGTEDIFVHMESVRRYGFTELKPGQVVLVRFGNGIKGCMAAELRPDGVPERPTQ